MNAIRLGGKTMLQLTLASFTALIACSANATLNTTLQRGESIIEIPVGPRKNPELCVIPKHFANVEYSERDLRTEKELCALNAYQNTAFCPKTNSTNPGVDVYSIPSGMTLANVEASDCKMVDPATGKNLAKKIAKYKQSTSCSYTPSILGYYHVSRLLGGIANVPVAVLRTLDLGKHIAIGRRALKIVKQGDLIQQTWSGLLSSLTAGADSKRRDFLLTDNFDQSYGALLDNVSGDLYKEFFNSGANNVARAQAFRDKNPIALTLAKQNDIAKLVGREFKVENLQRMLQVKEAADMFIIDTLMNQQDRFGNIDFAEAYVFLDKKDLNDSRQPRLKLKKKLKESEIAELGAIKVKRMVLSDNDCGVAKDNIAKQVGLVERIAHIDPFTYRRVLQLNVIVDHPHTKAFFQNELLFTDQDFASFRANLKEVATKLRNACVAKKLRLDLDLQAHFTGQPPKGQSCDL